MSESSLSIGQAAEACGISAECTRCDERIGPIPPRARHNGAARTGGNRLYGEADLRRLRSIGNSRALGSSLADIAELLALSDAKGCPVAQPRYRSQLNGHLDVVNERIDRSTALRERLEGTLATAQRGGLGGRCCCRNADAHPSSAVIRLFERGSAPLAARARAAV